MHIGGKIWKKMKTAAGHTYRSVSAGGQEYAEDGL